MRLLPWLPLATFLAGLLLCWARMDHPADLLEPVPLHRPHP